MSELRTMIRYFFASPRAVFARTLVLSFGLVGGGCSFNAGTHALTNGDTDGGLSSFDVPTFADTNLINADVVGGGGDAGACSQVLATVVRDFLGYPGPNAEPKHPDFEYRNGDDRGIAAVMLGADSKPIHAVPGATATTHSAALYDEWYRDTAGVNMRFDREIALAPDPTRPGTFVYNNDVYFPIDNMGWGNQGQNHNFHFTTEVHFEFPYRGGEVFTFRGDDDLWLFVNGRLAIDLGGVHVAEPGTVNLDQQAAALGITPGNTYRMDIFGAERHTTQSTFHIETTLQCIKNVIIP